MAYGPWLGMVEKLERDHETGAVDALIRTIDIEGRFEVVRLPADGRYGVEWEVLSSSALPTPESMRPCAAAGSWNA